MCNRSEQRLALITSNRGFSMIEVMITVVIFSMMMTGLYMAFNVGDASWKANFAKMSLQQEMRKAVDAMQYDLREVGRSSIFTLLDDTPQPFIIFAPPYGVASGSINWDSNLAAYYMSGNILRRVQTVGTPRIIAHDIVGTKFIIHSSTPNILDVEVTGQRTTTSGVEVNQTMNFQVSLRN